MIPCGKCIGCRLEYSKEWATKGCYEAAEHKENWFLTITYDNDHLPEAEHLKDPETGEDLGQNPNGTLKPEDMVLFIKKLRQYYARKYNHKGIRIMYCGEYGESLHRPHYHAIMFNMPIRMQSMKFHEYNENHEALWRVQELEKIWGKGMIVAAEVNWSTCAYVARYCTKKVGIPTQDLYYECLGIKPEFFRMSRRPGIGRKYYEENKNKIYSKDSMIVQKYGGGTMEVKPPKYYDKLYDLENHEKMEEIKKKRKEKQEIKNILKYSQTTEYIKEKLKNEEITKSNKAKALKRTKVK